MFVHPSGCTLQLADAPAQAFDATRHGAIIQPKFSKAEALIKGIRKL
jgi:hypothetical protein